MSGQLLYLDTETTGVDPYTDRIVEFSFQPEGGEVIIKRVNPERPIPAEATAVHGITDADVQGLPVFRQYARTIQELITDKILVGYNCRRFDTIQSR